MPEPRLGRLRWLSPLGYLGLAWWEWGPAEGAPVVCVHGLTRNGRDFDVLAAALAAQGRRVICPDLPGRGGSDRLASPALYQPPTYIQALSHLLARLDQPVDWVGTSLGGICGMGVAATPGNSVRRLVLNDIGSFIPRAALARIRDYVGTDGSFADLGAVERHLRLVHANFGALTDAQWAGMALHSAVQGPDGWRLHYDPAIAVPIRATEPVDVDMALYWNAVQAPTLVLRGETSDLLLPDTAAQMATKPGVRVETIPHCGHAPALMDPAQVKLVADFLS
jgi:pimeloyl-ACP methyl ester carboxylesterase